MKLLEPGMIGSVHLKNRAVSSPMITGYATRDGDVTDRLLRFYKAKAQGGMGLVIVEYSYIDQKASQSARCQLGAYDDTNIIGLARLSEVMHEEGAKTCLQLVHTGRQRFMGIPPIVAPSPVPWEALHRRGVPVPTELSVEEIHDIVESFGDAALRAKQAGFDMVELHGAHGYLITGFLSPHTNRRTDMYGGSLQGRMRFALEVVDNCRKKLGPDYPLLIRLSGSEYMDDGLAIEDTLEIAKTLENAGITAFDLSGGNHHTLHTQVVPSYLPLAFNSWAAEAVKQEVSIPVMATGSITSPALAETILQETGVDYIGFGRPFVADPYFMKKVQEGRPEDIRPCIRCCEGCLARGIMSNQSMKCSVNVAVGREESFGALQYTGDDPAEKTRNVMVIGGGPGGMEAARVAHLRGHHVILYEKRKQLGGVLIEASVPDFKQDLRPLIQYLKAQLGNLGVTCHLGKEVTRETVLKENPDVIIAATGADPAIPDVPGIDKPLAVDALQVFRGHKLGQQVVVIGGGMIGSEIGLWLAEQGKEVTVTSRQENPVYGHDVTHHNVIMERLANADVTLLPQLLLYEITDDGVIMQNIAHGFQKQTIPCDHVVIVAGFKPNRALVDELLNAGHTVIPVGDCVSARKIHDAIYEGHLAARSV